MKLFATSFLILCCLSSGFGQTAVGTSDETIQLSAEIVRLFDAGKFLETLPLAKAVVAKREKSYGLDHIMLGQSVRNLSYIELKLNRRRDALANFERALNIYELNEPLARSDQISQAEMFETVGLVTIAEGAPQRSVSKFQQAIVIRERLHGLESPEITGLLNALGQVYSGQGEFAKSAPLLLRSLEIRKKLSLDDPTDNLLLRESAACALNKIGRSAEADEINLKFRTISKNTLETPKDNTVDGGILNARALTLPVPEVPKQPKSSREDGKVNVRVLVNETGRVVFACAVSGPRLFQSGAETAAFRAVFSPVKFNGNAVKVSGTLTYDFLR